MKKILIAAALLALAHDGCACPDARSRRTGPSSPSPPTTNKPADVAWDRIGGHDWCGIAKFLDRRRAAPSIRARASWARCAPSMVGTTTMVEIAVARTPHSYTYAQPFTPIFYHGTMAVEPVDATHSKIVYTLIWNQTAVGDAAAQAAARDSRQMRFQAAVDKMAAAANAP